MAFCFHFNDLNINLWTYEFILDVDIVKKKWFLNLAHFMVL
jgi:hypothetical protein